MINTLLGTKKGMTSAYDSRGRRVGATVVEVSPNFVTQIKTTDSKDGYEAIQIGAGFRKTVKKPQLGVMKKAGISTQLNYFKEVRIKPVKSSSVMRMQDIVSNSVEGLELGQEMSLGQVFFVGDSIKVTGVSKGKGFQGGVKRHGFAGGPKTHGQSDRHRAPGSSGSGTTPGRVYKGKKMAGHMGVDTVSYTGLEILAVDKINNLVTVKGGIPGPTGGMVILEKQGKVRGYVAPPEPEVEEEKGDEEEMAEEVKVEETAVEEKAEEAKTEEDVTSIPSEVEEEKSDDSNGKDSKEDEKKEEDNA